MSLLAAVSLALIPAAIILVIYAVRVERRYWVGTEDDE